MYPDIVGCCKRPTVWIFVYQNDRVYGICNEHFYEFSHRTEVKDVINFQTQIRYIPETIFKEFPIRFQPSYEVAANV